MNTDSAIPRPDVRTEQPPHLKCGCGRTYDWEWWGPPDHLAHIPAAQPTYWRPVIDPCSACEPSDDEDLAARFARAQAKAEIPKRYRAYSWKRHDYFDEDESVHAFRKRCPNIMGLNDDNSTIASVCARWRPRGYRLRDGVVMPGHSLWLQGQVGVGKTLFVCALANDILAARKAREWLLTDEEMTRRYGEEMGPKAMAIGCNRRVRTAQTGGGVLFVSEADLHDRVSLAWAGDRVPLKQLAEAWVLILDDLGSIERPVKHQIQSIQRLVDLRYRAAKPFVITTNRDWSEIVDLYGVRTASRLAEMVDGTEMVLGGDDWRRG